LHAPQDLTAPELDVSYLSTLALLAARVQLDPVFATVPPLFEGRAGTLFRH
jgi:hypothetical protein